MSSRPLSRALPGRRELQRGEVVGEDRDDVDPHRLSSSSGNGVTSPGRSATTTRPAARSTSGTSAGDERHQRVAAVGRADGQQVLRGAVEHRGHLAERRAVDVVRRRARPAGGRRTPRGRRASRRAAMVGVQERCRARPRPRCGRRAPRSGPAARDWCQRVARDGQAAQRRPTPPALARSAVPAANRRSGSSVRTSTVTSPRRPCGLPIRPTTTSIDGPTLAAESPCQAVRPGTPDGGRTTSGIDAGRPSRRTPVRGQRRRSTSTKSIRAPPRPARAEIDGAERGRGAAVAADHLAEVVGVDPHLEDRAATQLLVADGDVVGVVDDTADQVLERVGEHERRLTASVLASAVSASSAAPSGVSSAGTSAGASAAGASAGLSACGSLGSGRLGGGLLGGASAGLSSASSAAFGLGLLGGLLGHRPALGLAGGVLEGLVEDLELVALGLVDLQGALGARQALELLPVAGDLEDLLRRPRTAARRRRASTAPGRRRPSMYGRVLLGVVLADLLDHLAVALLARVDDDDAVLRHPDLAQALQTDLDGHVCGVSSEVVCGEGPSTRWGHRVGSFDGPCAARMRGSGRAGLSAQILPDAGRLAPESSADQPCVAASTPPPPSQVVLAADEVSGVSTRPWLTRQLALAPLEPAAAVLGSRPCGRPPATPGCR